MPGMRDKLFHIKFKGFSIAKYVSPTEAKYSHFTSTTKDSVKWDLEGESARLD